jgi:tRNA threonylcarbamoyl adenosine modification protein YeaZ
MITLGLDTATASTVAAVRSSDGEVAVELRDDPAPGASPRHTTMLLSLAVQALARAGLGWAEIGRIAVGVGPGTFTGLRIGIATARALARARELPLVGVSTLESLALGAAGATGAESVIAVIDARRGEVFAAGWRADPDGRLAERTLAPGVFAPETLAHNLAKLRSALTFGDGAVKFRAILERSGASIPEDESGLHEVSALNHCRLALSVPTGSPDLVRPEYLRLPDAEIALRAAGNP